MFVYSRDVAMDIMSFYQGPAGKMHSRLPKFKYKKCKQSDTVVVVGAGGSTADNADLLNRYIRDNDSVVFGANYHYPCLNRMDYTYFGDWRRFRDRALGINSSLIVSSTIVDRFKPGLWKYLREQQECFEVFTRNRRHGNEAMAWRINDNGTFPQGKLSPSGFAITAMASLCRPKKMVLVGLDGPIVNKRRKTLVKGRFDGAVKDYGTYQKYKDRQRLLVKMVLPFLRQRGIEIYCPKSCPLWNINKTKQRIHTL